MAALRVAVFPLSAKNRRGGHFCPPPPVRVLKLLRGTLFSLNTGAPKNVPHLNLEYLKNYALDVHDFGVI